MPIATESGYPRPTFDEWKGVTEALYIKQYGTFASDGVNARLAEIDAQMAHSVCAMIEAEAKSFFPWRAKGSRLVQWGKHLIGDLKSAGTASGTVRLTGSDGAPVPTDAVFTGVNGLEYRAVVGGISAGGALDLVVTCSASGAEGNLSSGAVLTLVNPVFGLSSEAVVREPGLRGGTPAEAEEEYRARVLVRLREESTGGNDADHESWALEVKGVTRAWVRRPAMGNVLILFMMDATYGDGIPVGAGAPAYSGDLLAVYDHIEAEAPSPGIRHVMAPTPLPIHYVVHGLSPDTPETRAAIEAELRDLHVRRSKPGGVWRWSWGAEAVTTAAGTDSFDAIEPSGSIVPGEFEIPVFGSVGYVD